ncbi:MAG: AraC family transcriptional regulator [Opitutaceae bacterium]|nr:AraC family transcriptional regulator [Opitutaceae bacterium]
MSLLETVLADASGMPGAVFVHDSNPVCLSIAEGRGRGGGGGGGEPRGTNLALMDVPRFILVLGGAYRAICDINDRGKDRVARRGEFYWIHPDDWNLVRNDSARTILSVVFNRHFTRFLWYHHKREPGSERLSGAHTALYYHTNTPASVELRRAVSLMDAAADEGGVFLQPAARALLAWCLRELQVDERIARATAASGNGGGGGIDHGRRTFEEIRAYVTEHLQHELARGQVSGIFRISEDHLTRLFRIHARCGFVEFVRSERLRLAERLLATSRLSVKEVAVACGFNLSAYFIKRFRERHGVTPMVWRRRG